MTMKAYLLAFMFLPALAGGTPPPEGTPRGGAVPAPLELASESPSEIFSLVESGLRQADLSSASRLFGRDVFVSLKGGESGYYSSNQAYLIVQSFLHARRPVNFTFTTRQEGDEAFATGSGVFLSKGTRETLQVYVAVARQSGRWVISQFNVY
jgi:hypothetical protein